MKLKFVIASCGVLLFSIISFAQTQDSIKTYQLSNVDVVARKNIQPTDRFSSGTNYESSLFDKNGFGTLRRGVSFTQDLYVEGFKRSDIKVVVDGEQYHNACPNRMDVASTRINPLEMDVVDLSKSCCVVNAGIYGKVEYHRSPISDQFKIKSFALINAGASNDYDLGANLDFLNSNLSIRFAQGNPYKTAESKSFTDLYSYKENFKYTYGNVGLRHQIKDWQIGASFAISEDISFPYLQMDEKHSKIYSGFVSFKENKLYFNYTDHLMNNTLRKSTMFMESDAKNLTVGLTGKYYELVYRKWNADNVISMMNNSIANNQMPGVNQINGIASYGFDVLPIKLSVKGGAQYFIVGDEDRIDFYTSLYGNVDKNNFYLIAAFNAHSVAEISNDFVSTISAEVATDAPEAEQLYIAIERLGTNPNWSGNPTLQQPIKISLRTSLMYKFLSVEVFANHIHDYVNVVKKPITNKSVMTYENINANIMGINAGVDLKYIESSLSYLYGENLTNSGVLSEINPLSVTTSIRAPQFYGIKLSAVHHYENSMKRVVAALNESTSAAWNTIALNVSYSISNLVLNFEVDNLLNHNYTRHLSYTRNPFSSQTKVYDPGRTFRFTIYYDKLF